MKTIVAGMSDCKTSNDPDATLVTYALGSCIAVAIHDPASKTGGLLHYMLPESSLDVQKAKLNPHMFADTGIQSLLHALREQGVNPRSCVVRVAGGAQVLDSEGVFQIGKRNYLAAKKILWKEGLMIAAEAVGGEVSRTVRLELGSGRFLLREDGAKETELISAKGGALCRSAS